MNNNSDKIEKKGYLAQVIDSQNEGTFMNPTNLKDEVNKMIDSANEKLKTKIPKMHLNTIVDILETFETLKEIGFIVLFDGKGKLQGIQRTNEELTIKGELKQIKQEIIKLREKE